MAARKPTVMINGQQQDLPDGDTLNASVSNFVRRTVGGRVQVGLSTTAQKITVVDANIGAAMSIQTTALMANALKFGIICISTLISQSAGSFDVLIVQHYLDGKPVPGSKARNLITLNYLGA